MTPARESCLRIAKWESTAMITKKNMMVPFLDACPSFRGAWNEINEEWQDEVDSPLYIALSEIARYMVERLASGKAEELRAAFAVIEQWIVQGDSYVSEAAVIGLLENLQNENLHEVTEPGQFVPFLGPESIEWWKKVDAFWESGSVE